MTVFSAEFVHELLARVDALTKKVESLELQLAASSARVLELEAKVAELEAEVTVQGVAGSQVLPWAAVRRASRGRMACLRAVAR